LISEVRIFRTRNGKFISVSRELRERLAQEEKKRQERELEIAQKFNKKLRSRAILASVFAAVALISALIALLEARRAGDRAAFAGEQAKRAEEQARIAESRRLAAESTSVLTKYPQRSVLLAVEAVKVEQSLHGVRVAAGEQSLREALGFIGGRLVARADGQITTVAISPDNRWLVTGSNDNTARLWDLSAKDPAANPVVLRGHEGAVDAVAISPDNRWVVTAAWTIRRGCGI
jgi:hypothetical protein